MAFPSAEHWIFPKTGSSAAALGAIYQIGLLLMFVAGAEMRRLLQRDDIPAIGLIASFGLVLPFAAGLGSGAALGMGSIVGTAGNKTALFLVFGIAVAVAVAVASIPVISRIMHDAGLLGTRFSRIVLSVAVIEDIVLYVILAIAVGLVQPDGHAEFGVPTALNIHTVAQSALYHTVVAILFLGVAFTVGGRIYKALIGMSANPLRDRSPVAFQLLWMFGLSAAALALGLVQLYGAFVAGITVAIANDGEIVPESEALSGVSFGFFIPAYFALIGLQLDLLHHFDVLFFLGFLALRAQRKRSAST